MGTTAEELLVHVLALASAQARELAAEREARRQEQALIRSGQVLSAALDLDDVLPVILRELRHVVSYDTASVQERRGDEVVIVGGEGIDLDVFEGHGFDVLDGGTPNGDVLKGARPVIVSDILAEHPYWNFPHPAHLDSGVRCWMGVPLLLGGECTGMLTLDSYTPDFYTDEHARMALAFASQAAVALGNARSFDALRSRMAEVEALQEGLREQATRDPLTGLHNRRHLMQCLEREVIASAAEGSHLSVALIDVDHFKAVNDTYGHAIGDQVLADVAQLLASQVRETDVVCRYGGEEFVVLMPATTADEAARRADRWRRAVASLDSPAAPGHAHLTVSVGIAVAPLHASMGDGLLRAADEAMYAAKSGGRDRVVVAEA
ncbi:MAG: sensor domain-containing diguanylate cyclase [Acidimicrobiia bacterium]|nr:sensor domain-containing diguanylate cyclase [Acidimicrobiia bacterium]